jgi:hypothetical protein
MSAIVKKRGHYLGTEVDEKWWNRYLKDGIFARGLGEYWIEKGTLFFRRYLMNAPIIISLSDVVDVKVGKWHSGRWAGGSPVIKIIWNKAGNRLCSGFVLARDDGETEELVQSIRSIVFPQTEAPAR